MNSKACAFAALAVSLVACGKETHAPTDTPEVVTEQGFLEGVPADTPYVAAAVDPAPLAGILPWLQTLDDAAMPSPERVNELLADAETKPRKRRALALLAELTGHFTPAGLAELGFSANPRFALYGIGVLPAVRLEVEDPKKVGEFLSRVGERAGIESAGQRDGGDEYWTFPAVRHNRTIVIAMQGNTLLAGVTTPQAEATFVQHLLGNAEVESSLDDDDLRSVAKAWGLQNYSVGYVDLARLAQIIVAPVPGLNKDIFSTLRRDEGPISDACRDETLALVSQAPRVVFGSERWTASSISFGAALEVRSELASELAATKTGAPLAGMNGQTGVAGFAFDVGRAVEILRTRASAIAEQPFQCKWYAGINKGAEALSSRWSMLPPMVAQVQGGTLLVRDLKPTPEFAEERRARNVDFDAILALSTPQPVELFDFVKGFNNDLFELSVVADGTPISLPDTRGLDRLQSPQLVAHPHTLALTSGAWSADRLSAAALERQPAPFLFLSYDADAIAEKLQLDHPGRIFALRGTSQSQLEPTAKGFHLRSTYTRQIGE